MVQLRADPKAKRRQDAGRIRSRQPAILSDLSSALGQIGVAGFDDATAATRLGEAMGSDALDDALPLFITDLNGALLYANGAYRDVAATLSPADRIAESGALLMDGDLAGGPPRGEIAVEVGGQTRRFALQRQSLHDSQGTAVALLGRLTLIEDTRQQRQSLALSKDRFNDIARLVSDWVWETDRDLALTYISSRVTEALGYHPRELLGRRLDRIAAAPIAPLNAGKRSGTRSPFRGARVTFHHRSGEWRTFKLSGLPVYSQENGSFLGFRGTAQDVTKLLAHEAALRDAVNAAEAANRTKSEFLANTSHELRTPLNAIIGFSEIMHLEQFGSIGNPRYKEYAGNVLESAQHLLTLINDILDVAKIEAGKLELEEAAAEPAELCRQTLRLVEDRAARAGIALACELPGDLPRLRIDPRKVKQILLNLLSNAIKFTPRGGRVELAAGRRADGGFGFSVRDSGIGIAPEDQPTALAPFGQVDSQLARKFDGTGLGLPLSRALANLHGGDLELDSAPGQGTIVTVTLPKKRLLEE